MSHDFDIFASDRFSQNQQKYVSKLSRDFGQEAIGRLNKLLGCRSCLDFVSCRVKSYRSQIESLSDPTTLLALRLDGEFTVLLNLDFQMTVALFERLLGSGGQSHPVPGRSYLTDLEKTVLNIPFRSLVQAYQAAWQTLGPLSVETLGTEFSPHAMHLYRPSEKMMVSSYLWRLGSCQGRLEVSVPVLAIKSRLPRESFDQFRLTNEDKEEASATSIVPRVLYDAVIPVAASLGRAQLLFQELVGLEVGDVIRLDSDVQSPLEIAVSGKVQYLGLPGVQNRAMAAKIVKIL